MAYSTSIKRPQSYIHSGKCIYCGRENSFTSYKKEESFSDLCVKATLNCNCVDASAQRKGRQYAR